MDLVLDVLGFTGVTSGWTAMDWWRLTVHLACAIYLGRWAGAKLSGTPWP